MTQSRIPSRLIVGILIALFFGVALYIRIVLPYDQVFTGNFIKYTGVDAYYHMRLIDNLLHHFPGRINFDPYTFYPHGTWVPWPPFFDWFLGGIIWLIGLGSPSQQTIDTVGVCFPAVLGALTIIPIYFIGKTLFNRWAGVIAAGLMAVLPGEFLGRTILGFTDHHAAEVFFTIVTMLFLILAIRTAKQRQLNFSHLKHRDWSVLTRPLSYALLAGVFLGFYIITWIGGLLFVFLIFVYLVIQFIIDHLRGQSTDYLGIIGTIVVLVSLAISLPFFPKMTNIGALYLPAFIIAVLMPAILAILSWVMAKRKLAVTYYPLTLLGVGLVGLLVFYIAEPSLFESAISRFVTFFVPKGATLTILEAQPILFPRGDFTLSVVWAYFTTGFFLSLIALGILVYFVIKRGEADRTLLVVWCLVILAATLGRRRSAYYFATNVALLTGYVSWLILWFAGFGKEATQPALKPKEMKKKKAKQKKVKKESSGVVVNRVKMASGVIVVFFLAFFPNITQSINTAKVARYAPSDAWCQSLSWLRENTPEPFGDPESYYELYKPSPFKENYSYPESTYGVMVWWDYGHWVTRIAHRIPISNPFQQGASKAGEFFTSQDEASATKIMDELEAKYVITDKDTATNKFYAVSTFTGISPEKFSDVYYQRQQNRLVPITVFYPEYYHSLAIRLYNFNGKAVIPKYTYVISYEERIDSEGRHYKEITGSKSFPTYEEAAAYISNQKADNYSIAGFNPFISPVPLEEMNHYKLIYQSDVSTEFPDVGLVPVIRIFEYIK